MVKESSRICLDIVNELYEPDTVQSENIIVTAQIGECDRTSMSKSNNSVDQTKTEDLQ